MNSERATTRDLIPRETAGLLQWFVRNGFTTHVAGRPDWPDVLVLARVGAVCIDVVHVRGADRTEVARLPNDEHADIWQPRAVCWHYYGSLVDALRALQRLHARVGDSGPRRMYEPPRDGNPRPLTVTRAERGTLAVRPPRTHPRASG